MAYDLTSKNPSETYKSILKIDTGFNHELTTSPRIISDGIGNDSALSLSQANQTIGATFTGNVGIGTTAPGTQLEIASAGTDAPTFRMNRAGDNAITVDDQLGQIQFYGLDSATAQGASIEVDADGTWDTTTDPHTAPTRICFHTQDISADNTLGTSRMTIKSTGYIGIGTTTPTALLHISGTSSDTDYTNAALISGSAPGLLIRNTTNTDDTFCTLQMDAQEGGNNQTFAIVNQATDEGSSSGTNRGNYAPKVHFLQRTESAELEAAMTIDADANIGIGTDTPLGLLHLEKVEGFNAYMTCITSTEGSAGTLIFRKADDAVTAVDDNAVLGQVAFQGMDEDSGGSYITGASIVARVDGAPGADDMPCDLEFWTNTGASAPVLNAYVAEGGDFYTNDGSVSSIASDERLKKDIRDFTHGLSVVNQLNPVYYKFNGKNGKNEDVEDRIGMLANVVKDIAPDITRSKMGDLDGVETELWTMSYDKLIFYVVNAIQELSAKVDALESA